jgi:hypothetical protein
MSVINKSPNLVSFSSTPKKIKPFLVQYLLAIVERPEKLDYLGWQNCHRSVACLMVLKIGLDSQIVKNTGRVFKKLLEGVSTDKIIRPLMAA